MQHEILLGQIVSFMMLAVPSVLALVLGLEEIGKKFFGYECSHGPQTYEAVDPREWPGMFEDTEEVERRHRLGLPPRTTRDPDQKI